MQTYMSGTYQGSKGGVAKNLFIILTVDEKERLAALTRALEEDRDKKIADGSLKPMYTKGGKLMSFCKRPGTWVGKDEEAIVFLKRMCLWLEWDFSENIDPTTYQLDTIVNKTIQKIYGPHIKFYEWLKVNSTGILKKDEMYNHMQFKREIVENLKNKGRLPEHFPMP